MTTLRRRKTYNKGSGNLSELRTGVRMGAKQTPASGALKGFKGDLNLYGFMIECKSTVQESMGLKLEWLRKVSREARQEGARPAVHLSFVHENGNPVSAGTWIMVREVDLLELLEDSSTLEGLSDEVS